MQRMKDELFGSALVVEDHSRQGTGGHGSVLHELDLNPPRSRPGSRSAMRRGSGTMAFDDDEYGISTPPDGLSQSMLEMSIDEDHTALQISPTDGSSDGLLHAALASMSSPGSVLADDGKRVLQAAFEDDVMGGIGCGKGSKHQQQSIFRITSEEKGLFKDVLIRDRGLA